MINEKADVLPFVVFSYFFIFCLIYNLVVNHLYEGTQMDIDYQYYQKPEDTTFFWFNIAVDSAFFHTLYSIFLHFSIHVAIVITS